MRTWSTVPILHAFRAVVYGEADPSVTLETEGPRDRAHADALFAALPDSQKDVMVLRALNPERPASWRMTAEALGRTIGDVAQDELRAVRNLLRWVRSNQIDEPLRAPSTGSEGVRWTRDTNLFALRAVLIDGQPPPEPSLFHEPDRVRAALGRLTPDKRQTLEARTLHQPPISVEDAAQKRDISPLQFRMNEEAAIQALLAALR